MPLATCRDDMKGLSQSIEIALARLDHLPGQLHHLVEPKAVKRQEDEMQDEDRIITAEISKCNEQGTGRDPAHPERDHRPHRKRADRQQRGQVPDHIQRHVPHHVQSVHVPCPVGRAVMPRE